MGLTATQFKSLFMVESPFSIVRILPNHKNKKYIVNIRFFPIVQAFDDSLINEFVVNNWVTFPFNCFFHSMPWIFRRGGFGFFYLYLPSLFLASQVLSIPLSINTIFVPSHQTQFNTP